MSRNAQTSCHAAFAGSGLARTLPRGSHPLPDTMENPQEFILQSGPSPSAPSGHIKEVGPDDRDPQVGVPNPLNNPDCQPHTARP
jgi:hypothetical protein